MLSEVSHKEATILFLALGTSIPCLATTQPHCNCNTQHTANDRSLVSHTGAISLFSSFSISPSSRVVERAWQKTIATYEKGLPLKVSIKQRWT